MTEEQIMLIEKQRLRDLLADAIADIEAEGGSIRFFAAAFLVEALRLHVQIEGPNNLDATITKLGVRHLTQNGDVGRC